MVRVHYTAREMLRFKLIKHYAQNSKVSVSSFFLTYFVFCLLLVTFCLYLVSSCYCFLISVEKAPRKVVPCYHKNPAGSVLSSPGTMSLGND